MFRIDPNERKMMLYTACASAFEKLERKMKSYFVMKNYGNDAVVPDQGDLEGYRNGIATWGGFKVNYLAKLMRPEADEWMRRVSAEAVSEDVVLVSVEEDIEHCYRIMLAEMMMNMFSGQMNLRYMGELK